GVSTAVAERFNAQAAREIEGIRDFIVLHYRLNERDDSDFWRGCREMTLPDSLVQRIALFGEAAHAFQDSHDLFRFDSWVQVMLVVTANGVSTRVPVRETNARIYSLAPSGAKTLNLIWISESAHSRLRPPPTRFALRPLAGKAGTRRNTRYFRGLRIGCSRYA